MSTEELFAAKTLIDTDGDGIISTEEIKAFQKKYFKRKSHWCSICIVNPRGQFITLSTPQNKDEPTGQVSSFFCDCDHVGFGECEVLNSFFKQPAQLLCNMQLSADDTVNEKTLRTYIFTNLRDSKNEFIKAKHVIKHFESKKNGFNPSTKATAASPGIYIYTYFDKK